jgi:hypothetical protein
MRKVSVLLAAVMLVGCANNPHFYDAPPDWASIAWVDQDKFWYIPKKNAKVYPFANDRPLTPQINGLYFGVPYSEALVVKYESGGVFGSTTFTNKGFVTHIHRYTKPAQREFPSGR